MSGEIRVNITAEGVDELVSGAEAAAGAIENLGSSASSSSDGIGSLEQSMSSAGSSAEGLGQSAEGAAGSTDTLGQSTEGAAGSTDSLAQSTEGAAGSSDTMAGSLEGAATSTETLAASSDTAATSTDLLGTGLETGALSADTLSTSTDTLATSEDTLTASTDTLVGSEDTLATSTEAVGSTMEATEPAMSDVADATEEVGTSADDASGSIDDFTDAESNIEGQLASVTPALDETASSTEDVATNSEEATTNVDDFSDAAQRAENTQLSFAQNLGLVATSFTALSSAVLNTYQSYRGLDFAETNLDGKRIKYQKSVDALRTKYEALHKEYKDGDIKTDEYRKKLQALDNTANVLTNTKEKLGQAQEKLGWKYQDFYMSLVPTAIGVIGSFATVWGVFGNSLKGATNGVAGATGIFGRFGLGLGPIAIALAVLGTAFVALKTNAFGVTDTLLGFGKTLGDLVPSAKPLLGMIAGIGGALGLLGDDSTKWSNYFMSVMQSTFEFVRNLFTHTLPILLGQWKDWISGIVTAISSGDVIGAINLLIEGVSKGFQGFAAFFGEFIAPLGKAIIDAFQNEVIPNLAKIGGMILEGFKKAIGEIGPTVSTLMAGLAKTFGDFFNDGLTSEFEAAIINAISSITGIPVSEVERLWNTFWESTQTFFESSAEEKGKVIMTAIIGGLQWTADIVAPAVTSFFNMLTDLIPSAPEAEAAGKALVLALKEGVIKAAEILTEIGGLIMGMIFGTGGVPSDTQKKISEAVNAIANAIKQAFTTLAAFLLGIGSQIATEIMNGIKAVDWKQAGADSIELLRQGLIAIGNAMISAGTQIATWIIDAIKAVDWKQAGADTIELLRQGLIAIGNALIQAGTDIATWVIDAIKDVDWKQAGADSVELLRTGLIAIGNSLIQAGTDIATWVIDAVVKGEWRQTGVDAVTAVKDGLLAIGNEIIKVGESIVQWVIDGIQKAPDAILNALKGLLPAAGDVGAWFLDAINPFDDANDNKQQPLKVQNATLPTGGGEGGAGNVQALADALMMFDPAAFETQLQGVITKLNELGTALTTNLTAWQTWATTIQNTHLVFVSNAILAFMSSVMVNFNTATTAGLLQNEQAWLLWSQNIQNIHLTFVGTAILTFLTTVMVNFNTATTAALLLNEQAWLLWGTNIQNIHLLFVSTAILTFLAEVMVNFNLATTAALLLNEQAWLLWSTNIQNIHLLFVSTAILTFLAEVMVNFNLAIQEALLTQEEESWLVWATNIRDVHLVFVAESILQFLEEVFIPFNDGVLQTLTEQLEEGWTPWTEDILKDFLLLAETIDEFFNGVFEPFKEGVITGLDDMSKAWIQHANDVLKQVSNAANSMLQYAKILASLRDGVIKAAQDMSDAWEEHASSVADAVDDMIDSFEDLISTIEDIEDAANSATKALEAMARAAEKAAAARSKVGGARFGGTWVSGFRHGGSFINPGSFAQGGSFISTEAQKFRGANISEMDKWEMVTVTPLSNPYDASDKNSGFFGDFNIEEAMNEENVAGNAMSRSGMAHWVGTGEEGAGAPDKTIYVQGILNANVVMPDGRIIAQSSSPYIMEGQDADF